jgi:hypothetical protein
MSSLTSVRNDIFLYALIFVVSLGISVDGVMFTVHVRPQYPEDGTRGGAIAVALSFAVLFVRRPYFLFQNVFELKRKFQGLLNDFSARIGKSSEPVDEKKPEALLIRIQNLEEAITILIKTEIEDQSIQTWFLVASSVCGTLFWGFGDWFVYWIEAGKIYWPPS